MAKPKIALVPSAQGSKFYSVLPSSGVGDFDFTRSGSATRINSQGLIETVGNGVSRLNYPMIDGKVVGCPHHILEPTRTNLITYSEDFSQSYWTKDGLSIISNQVISPDGTLNADKLIEGTNSGIHKIVKPYTGISGTNTCSIFVKPNGVTKIGITSTESVSVLSSFDLSNGTLISSLSDDYSITPFPNGWFRISSTDIGGNRKMAVFLLNDTGNYSYQGDGVSGVYIYGAMLEQGSYPTSYIPTNGSSVTRSAETATGSGDASTFNDSEGVLMAEISALDDDNTNRFISLSSGQYQNRVAIFFDATNNNINVQIRSNDVNQPIVGEFNNYNIKEFNKILIKYKKNDVDIYINGFLLSHNTNCNMAVGLSEIAFDDGGGLSDLYGNTKQVQYFDTTLTNSELETLTSWVSFQDMAEGQLYTIE
jgi:hypothetical protein